jgi:hypothetical protein
MFAYELLGEKPPQAAAPRPGTPDALLSASHGVPGRNAGAVMAPVYPPPSEGAMRHMTQLNTGGQNGGGEELAER